MTEGAAAAAFFLYWGFIQLKLRFLVRSRILEKCFFPSSYENGAKAFWKKAVQS